MLLEHHMHSRETGDEVAKQTLYLERTLNVMQRSLDFVL